ncbi:hypothetical protein [Amycolatopsis aidingensis]|uniref:hypothetical protein n=1 Tax=Amycolatopsis aidingensis TaxID=2842453 RepID=UPI001E52436C|nr:hypothetical protein [Amycolatopsis aidingensis]
MALSGRRAEPGEILAVVRPRPGVVGESKRVCHVVPIPESGRSAGPLAALCGEPVVPAEVEVLPQLSGMPCELCVANSTPGRAGPLPAAG